MQVLLNSEKLDIQLENESSLGEVLQGISDWLKSGGQSESVHRSSLELEAHYLTEFVLDGERFQVSKELSRFSQKPSEINKLELFSEMRVDKANILLKSLYSLRSYFDMALQALDKKYFTFLEKLFCEAGSLLEFFERSVLAAEQRLRMVHSESVVNPLENSSENPLIGELKANLELWNHFRRCPTKAEPLEGATERTMAVFQDAFLLLDELYKDCVANIGSNMDASQIAASLEQKGKELSAALKQLQRGGGIKQSLDCVAQLSRLLEHSLQHEGDTLAGLFVEMRPFLHLLGSAIEEMDMVSVSDLAEYEIMPLIKQVISSLNEQ